MNESEIIGIYIDVYESDCTVSVCIDVNLYKSDEVVYDKVSTVVIESDGVDINVNEYASDVVGIDVNV